jgi:hypothetical protein
MLVLHNLDEKTTQVYDLNLNDYDQPILIPNLSTDHSHINNKFLSDLFLAEELPKESQSESTLA